MIKRHERVQPKVQDRRRLDGRGYSTLFIGGVGRSGTTILELSLGTDPRVVSLGEVMHLWERCLIGDERCGCRAAFSDCPFWIAVGALAFGGWSEVDAERVLHLKGLVDRTVRAPQLAFGLGGRRWRQAVGEYASYYARLYAAAAQVSGADVVVDSSKQASLPYILRLIPEVDLKVLHFVRDSRAVAHSWNKTVTRPEARDGARSVMTRYSPGVLALTWVRHNVVVDGLRPLGVPTMRMRYEDWAISPDRALRRVTDFLGLPARANPHVGADWVQMPAAHTCSGNPMRFQTGRVQVRRDDEWQRLLPGRHRRLVTAMTGPLLATYGYLRTKP